MPSSFSIKLGDFLYKNVFPVYNLIYPFFKRRQDKHEIALMNQYIRKGDVVLDIGANIGFYTKILSGLVGENGKVYAFEPDKTNYSHLIRNAVHLQNVEFHNKAVSDKSGSITLFHSDLLNVDHKTYATNDYTSTSEIECVALDDLIPEQKVDFIKIDIQGYEYFAFQGMTKIFEKNHHLKIIAELYPYGLKNSGTEVSEFISLIQKNKLIIYKMHDGQLSMFTDNDIRQMNKENYRIHILDIFLSKKPLN